MESLKKAAVNLKDKLTKTGLERLIIESTINDDSLAPKNILYAIAERTNSHLDIETIMKALWENLRMPEREWRKINKTLGLIDILLLAGSPRIVSELRDSAHMLKTYESFNVRENGIEKGGSVRDKARQINYLLSNPGILENEREVSRRTREKFVGISSEDYGGNNTYDIRRENHSYQGSHTERQDRSYDQIFGNPGAPAQTYVPEEPRQRTDLIQNEPHDPYHPRQEQRAPPNGNSWQQPKQQQAPVHDIFMNPPAENPHRRVDPHQQHRQRADNIDLIPIEQPASGNKDLISATDIFQAPQKVDIFQPISHQAPPAKVANPPVFHSSQAPDSMFKNLNKKAPPTASQSQSWIPDITNISINSTEQQNSHNSPQLIPQAFPQTAPLAFPQTAPLAFSQDPLPTFQQPAPQTFPQTSPQAFPSTLPQAFPQTTHQRGQQIPNFPSISLAQTSPQVEKNPLPIFQNVAKPAPQIKMSHNMETTSGISITQLKMSPSLVQAQTTQAPAKQEKPKNLEDALLNLDDLSSSLSVSKEIKPARNLGF